ncbi:hypothetical protein RRF57_006144 [Xylaria bambusicola]|uniref:Uncharacterized protein n=1 Tax=Xylaria bambusicola TaxID=326684 RepID=A0AAN7UDT5_9PEZI
MEPEPGCNAAVEVRAARALLDTDVEGAGDRNLVEKMEHLATHVTPTAVVMGDMSYDLESLALT